MIKTYQYTSMHSRIPQRGMNLEQQCEPHAPHVLVAPVAKPCPAKVTDQSLQDLTELWKCHDRWICPHFIKVFTLLRLCLLRKSGSCQRMAVPDEHFCATWVHVCSRQTAGSGVVVVVVVVVAVAVAVVVVVLLCSFIGLTWSNMV